MKTEKITWSKIELTDPVSFRDDGSMFIIRTLKNVKGRVMCELEMDDDKMMRPFDFLPADVQGLIKSQISATV